MVHLDFKSLVHCSFPKPCASGVLHSVFPQCIILLLIFPCSHPSHYPSNIGRAYKALLWPPWQMEAAHISSPNSSLRITTCGGKTHARPVFSRLALSRSNNYSLQDMQIWEEKQDAFNSHWITFWISARNTFPRICLSPNPGLLFPYHPVSQLLGGEGSKASYTTLPYSLNSKYFRLEGNESVALSPLSLSRWSVVCLAQAISTSEVLWVTWRNQCIKKCLVK